jgi:uncharacterized protein YjaG (DUF416 family)
MQTLKIPPTREFRASSVRVTVDLPPTEYAALKRWELEAAVETGQAEVTNQAVLLRALAGRLLTDEQLAESVRQDISSS